jgi:N-acetylneuraminate lyase
MNKQLDGLIAAPFTPFNADGSLNPRPIKPLALRLAQTGASGAFVNGTTGEGASMTVAERKQTAAEWRRSLPKGLRLVVHVGANSTGDARELAAHAEKNGADAIASIAPGFFKPATVGGLVDWCAEVAAAAPKTPFYYYHMPSMTGVNFPMAEFLPLAAKKIPTFGGIKFTHENLMDYGLALEAAKGAFSVLFGRDEILLSALALGAAGAVGSTYNYACPIYRRVIGAFRAGDMAAARAAQLESMRFIEAFCQFGGAKAMAANKAILGLLGIDLGPVRAPLVNVTPAEIARLKASLKKIGFFKAVAV